MMTIPLPRLLDDQLREIRRLHPIRVAVDQTLSPLASATMELMPGDVIGVRQFVELFTAQGSAGVFRVTTVEDSYTGVRTVSLQHGLTTLQDALMPGEGERDTSARALLTELLSHQKGVIRWALGEVDVPDAETLHWEYDHTNLLSGLCDLLDKLPDCRLTLDQSVQPWVLGLAKMEQEPSCECRASRNIEGVTVTRDDAELVTRLYVEGLPEPIEADTIGVWGPVERTMSADEELGEELIRKEAIRQLENNKNPIITVTMEALELSRLTGEPLDALTLGRMCRVCLPEWQAVILQRIIALSWPDVYGQPERVTVTLANAIPNAADAIAGLVVDTTLLKKGYGDNKKRLILQAEVIELLGNQINLEAERIAAMAEQIELRATHIELKELDDRFTQEINNVGIVLDSLNAQIALKASAEQLSGLDTRLSSAELLIDGLNSQITLKADKIDLQGYVRADELETDVLYVLGNSYIESLNAGSIGCESISANGTVWCEDLSAYTADITTLQVTDISIAGKLNIDTFKASAVQTDSLTLGGTPIGMTSRGIVSGIYWPNFYVSTKTLEFMDPAGGIGSMEVVTGVHGVTSPTLQYETFYYLGGASE